MLAGRDVDGAVLNETETARSNRSEKGQPSHNHGQPVCALINDRETVSAGLNLGLGRSNIVNGWWATAPGANKSRGNQR
jgi:hypothetical protein